MVYNVTCAKANYIQLGAVAATRVSSFYNSVLPRDGYKITGNTLITTNGDGLSGPEAEIKFTGHGYEGTIYAVSNMGAAMASAGISPSDMPTNMTGDLITIELSPPGAAACPSATP